ncbi:hypothetical protein HK096_005594, partial [Nowakowskiella sp. JEL0078]
MFGFDEEDFYDYDDDMDVLREMELKSAKEEISKNKFSIFSPVFNPSKTSKSFFLENREAKKNN